MWSANGFNICNSPFNIVTLVLISFYLVSTHFLRVLTTIIIISVICKNASTFFDKIVKKRGKKKKPSVSAYFLKRKAKSTYSNTLKHYLFWEFLILFAQFSLIQNNFLFPYLSVLAYNISPHSGHFSDVGLSHEVNLHFG